ncbi:MAG TPA: hypothetical protein VFM69_01150 [Pricia sp.]|nr:hypothetical protein [Pricia sp.]
MLSISIATYPLPLSVSVNDTAFFLYQKPALKSVPTSFVCISGQEYPCFASGHSIITVLRDVQYTMYAHFSI